MTIFDEANQDGYRGGYDEGSVGPRLGFQEGFSAAWDSATKVHALLAVEQGIRAVEQDQRKRILEAGLRPPDSLDDAETVGDGPFGGAQFRKGRYSDAAQAIIDGGGNYTDEMVAARDKHLKQLQMDRPDLGIMTYGDMFKKVQDDAQEIEKRNTFPTSFGGKIGKFAGGMAGGMDPVSNPINAATLAIPIGEMGVIARAATQGAGQGVAEGINLALSDPENILLGHERTPGEVAGRIGMAAAGGVVADLGFRGAGAVVRRVRTGKWFSDVPEPKADVPVAKPVAADEGGRPMGEVPAPMKPGLPLHEYPDFETFARAHGETPMPYGTTREAQARTALDLDHVQSELQRWDGPAPWEVKPPETMTALPRDVETRPAISTQGARQRYMDSLSTVDDIARRIDPDLFAKYDRLQAQIDEARGKIEAWNPEIPTVGARANEILRRVIQKADEQMRDMAPLVTRAYNAARQEWRTSPIDHDTLDFLRRIEQRSAFRFRGEGEPSLTERPMKIEPRAEPVVQPKTVNDQVPLANMAPEVDRRVGPEADAAERVHQNVKHQMEMLDAKVEGFVGTVKKIAALDMKEVGEKLTALEEKLKAEKDPIKLAELEKQKDELTNITMPDGQKISLDHDVIPFIDKDGNVQQMSARDFLREMNKNQEALQSVTTCSRPS